MQLCSTMTESEYKSSYNDETDARNCYEWSIEAEAKGWGFSGSASANMEKCTSEKMTAFQSNRDAFQSKTSEESIVGGQTRLLTNGKKEFVVYSPQGGVYTILLTNKDKYPSGESPKYTWLTEFLSPEKIYPLEFRTHQITEIQFEDRKAHLLKHTLEHLVSVGDVMDDCDSTPQFASYLVVNEDGGLGCKCYSPGHKGFTYKGCFADCGFGGEGCFADVAEDIVEDSMREWE